MADERTRSNHDDDDDNDRYFELDALARYSSLSLSTLRRFLRDRAHPLPHHVLTPDGKRRGRILVSRRAFDAWVKSFPGVRARIRDDDGLGWVRRAFNKD